MSSPAALEPTARPAPARSAAPAAIGRSDLVSAASHGRFEAPQILLRHLVDSPRGGACGVLASLAVGVVSQERPAPGACPRLELRPNRRSDASRWPGTDGGASSACGMVSATSGGAIASACERLQGESPTEHPGGKSGRGRLGRRNSKRSRCAASALSSLPYRPIPIAAVTVPSCCPSATPCQTLWAPRRAASFSLSLAAHDALADRAPTSADRARWLRSSRSRNGGIVAVEKTARATLPRPCARS